MTNESTLPQGWLEWGIGRTQQDAFERDVHILILGTLHAGITYLNTEAQKEDDELAPHFKTATGEDLAYLEEKRGEIWGYVSDQERFLRNMALVALISRLTHTLNSMIRSVDHIAERNPEGYGGNNEFQKLWREFEHRFGVKCPPKHIAFIEPLRKARNLIVHHGAEANPLKPENEINIDTEFEDLRDNSFSEKYPQYVHGDGYNAEVSISDNRLNYVTKKAVGLTKWLATELDGKEKEYLAGEVQASS